MDFAQNWVEVLAAVGSILAFLVSLAVNYKVTIVHRETNSMKDQLVRLARAEGHASGAEEGIAEGRKRQKADDVENSKRR